MGISEEVGMEDILCLFYILDFSLHVRTELLKWSNTFIFKMDYTKIDRLVAKRHCLEAKRSYPGKFQVL